MRRSPSTARLLAASVLVLSGCAHGPPRVAATDPCTSLVASGYEDPASEARDSVIAMMAREPMPGAAAAVSVDGRLVWSEAIGLADLEAERPACRNTLFRAGSVSKIVTAAALLRLADAGTLDLDDDIRRHVSAVADKPHPITFRQLAGHLGGIRHYGGAEYFNTHRFERVEDGLASFIADPLVAAPGTEYRYSSYGYNLLGAAMERAAGMDYLSLVDRTVLSPLSLERTHAESTVDSSPHLASHYSGDSESLRASPSFDTSDRWPSGGWVATAEDMALLGAALVDEDFLSTSARNLLLTPQRNAAGEETGYSIGVRVEFDERGRRMLHHGGTSVGARAFLLVYPEQGVTVAMAANGPATFDQRQLATIASRFMEFMSESRS